MILDSRIFKKNLKKCKNMIEFNFFRKIDISIHQQIVISSIIN